MPAALDLGRCIENAARTQPDELFLKTAEGRQCTYRSLIEQSARYAAALAQWGVAPGDRIAVQVEKSVEAVLLYIACLMSGVVFVPINTANTANEVEYFLRDSKPRLAVLDPSKRAAVEPLARDLGLGNVETLDAQGEGSLSTRVRGIAAAAHSFDRFDAGALASIIYTSGTTGRSKGAMLTRGNLASNAAALAEAWHFSRTDVLQHVLPLFHVHGLFVAINTVLASASSLLLMAKSDAASTLEHMPAATVFMGVPTHYTRLLQQAALSRETTAGMRLFVSGSAPLAAATHEEFRRRTGHEILERYGMTETLINTSNPYESERLAGSVGLPLPGVSIRVAGAGLPGAGVGADGIGTLEVRGANVFAGYWMDDAKTRSEFTGDGWFKTGDLGRIDGRGYVYIVGRAKDLVISGGYNVYPKEIEAELDALAGVLESAVFGVPHPDFGEGVTAVVVPRSDANLSESEILSAMQRRVARYKLPKRVLVIAELPRNTMGKVQKNALRQRYAALYASNTG
jgi:malonyl-CoA/methylmalonyl-CoA synthetase